MPAESHFGSDFGENKQSSTKAARTLQRDRFLMENIIAELAAAEEALETAKRRLYNNVDGLKSPYYTLAVSCKEEADFLRLLQSHFPVFLFDNKKKDLYIKILEEEICDLKYYYVPKGRIS